MGNTPENSLLTLFFGTQEAGLLSEARKEAEKCSEELKIGGGVNVIKMGLNPRKSPMSTPGQRALSPFLLQKNSSG